ncbi:MAG: hypothetical protein NVS9B6_18920 [Candidatus Limnocylindrales bacterium]
MIGYIRGLLPVKREERLLVLFLYALLTVMVFSDWIGKVGADAIFVKRVGVTALPVLYILTPAVMLVASGVIFGLVDRLRRRDLFVWYIGLTALLSVGTQAAFVLGTPGYWWAYIFAHVVKETIYLIFWVYAGNLFDSEQSKRIFPLFAGALLVGKIGGGVAASLLQPIIHPDFFMAAQAVGFLLAFVLVFVFRRHLPEGAAAAMRGARPAPGGPADRLRASVAGYRTVVADRLLRVFGVGVFFWYFLMQVANYVYTVGLDTASQGATLQASEDSFAVLYASVYTGGSIVALVLQTFLTGGLLRRLGVSVLVFAFPLWYLATFGASWISLTLITAVLLQAGERIIVPAIHLPSIQVVYGQVSAELRPRARAFFSGSVNAFGNIAAAIVLLLGAVNTNPRGVLLLGTVGSGAFLANTVLLRRVLGRRIAENLQTEDPELRRNAAQMLSGEGAAVPTDHLRAVLKDASADVEAGVRLALTRRGALSAAVEANAE